MASSNSHCSLILILSVYMPAIFLHCEAGRAIEKRDRELKSVRHSDEMWSSSLDSAYGIGSPFESLAPVSMPQQGGGSQNTPPYCIYPPFTPTPTNPYSPPAPSSNVPPIFPILSPPVQPSLNPYPPPQSTLSPPSYVPGLPPSPPSYIPTPTTPTFEPSPPSYVPTPTTPSFEPSPPSYIPTPGSGGGNGGGGAAGGSGGGGGRGGGFAPNPPVFQPPVIYPPPAVPPPPHPGENLTLWCVAKPSVPDPIIQEAMNYACGSGADCNAIQPNGNCYQPNTVLAHASYAFNSYWQMTKVGGGTCEFGGTAILITADPSHEGCHYLIT